MPKLEPSKQYERPFNRLRSNGSDGLVNQLVSPQMGKKAGHADAEAVICSLIALCGEHPSRVGGTRYDLGRIVSRPGEAAFVARLIPALAVLASVLRQATPTEKRVQKELLPDGTLHLVPRLPLHPDAAGDLIRRIATDVAHQDAQGHLRHPVNYPENFRAHAGRLGRTELAPTHDATQAAEWHRDHVVAGVHMAISLRHIALSRVTRADRMQAFELWEDSFTDTQLAQVESLIVPLKRRVARIVAKPDELDRLPAGVQRHFVGPHANLKITPTPVY